MKYSAKDLGKDLFFDIAGGIIYAMGIITFAKPARFAVGGLNGFSMVVNHVTNIPIGMITFAINIPLILFSYKILGKFFMLRTAKSMVIVSVILDVLGPMLPVYSGDPMIAAIFAGLCDGIGMGSFYIRGGSTGGIDFITMSIRKMKPHLQLGTMSITINAFVLLCAIFAFGNIDAALYGAVAIFISGTVIDKMMYGVGAGKMLLIITTKGKEIASEISNATHRGSSIIHIQGAYTNDSKELVMSACSKSQVFAARKTAYNIDPACFVMITSTDEVFGNGFLMHNE